MNNNKQQKINTFYLAAFLLTKGVSLIDIEKVRTNRVNFIFPSSDKVNELIRVFNFGSGNENELMVNFKQTETAIKKLKSLIYD